VTIFTMIFVFRLPVLIFKFAVKFLFHQGYAHEHVSLLFFFTEIVLKTVCRELLFTVLRGPG